VFVTACGGAAATVPAPAKTTAPTAPAKPVEVDEDIPAIDALTGLSKTPELVASIVPKTGQLEPGGPALTVPEGAAPVQVVVLEKHGADVRVGVWLEHVRFALWTDKQWLLATVREPVRVSSGGGGDFVDLSRGDPVEVELQPGAHVRRIAHKDQRTQIRYIGAVEVDGWIPDDALALRAPPADPVGRIPSGRPTLMVTPGAAIRTEPRWGTRTLAVMANGYFLDTIQELDDGWVEVGYADGDVRVHGYVGKHEPPERTHRPHADENPPPPTATNQLVPAGTCLYAKRGGEPIGFVAIDAPFDVEDAEPGWWTVTTDTPWGPVTFVAQGPTKQDLVGCAPAGSVPVAPPTPTP
jgi:hypothetical protein